MTLPPSREPSAREAGTGAAAPPSAEHEHPIGTLAIVGLYGLLFAVGWLAMYLFVFLPRGRVTP